jgi:hypothetical protein
MELMVMRRPPADAMARLPSWLGELSARGGGGESYMKPAGFGDGSEA